MRTNRYVLLLASSLALGACAAHRPSVCDRQINRCLQNCPPGLPGPGVKDMTNGTDPRSLCEVQCAEGLKVCRQAEIQREIEKAERAAAKAAEVPPPEPTR